MSRFDSFVEDNNEQPQGLAEAEFASKQTNPDQFAKVYELAKKKNLPTDFVERNYERLSEDSSSRFSQFVNSSPKLTEYLSNVENAKISKDDTESLSGIENRIGMLEKTGGLIKSISSGAMTFVSNSSKAISMMPDISELITGDTFKTKGNPYVKAQQDILLKNPITQKLDQMSADLKPAPLNQDDIITNMVRGDFYPLAVEIAFNLPQVALTAINPMAGLAILSASSSGAKLEQNLKAGADRETAVINALATGTIESVIETTGGIGGKLNPLKDTIKNAASSLGEQTVLNSLKNSFGIILKTSREEGLEEFATEMAQSTLDWAMDVDPAALDNVLVKSLNAFVVGAGAGGATTVGAIAGIESQRLFTKDVETYQKKVAVNQAAEFYENVGEQVKESKTFKRAPEKMSEYIKAQTEGTAVESVYLDVEKFDEYFQSKKLDPNVVAKDFGFEKEYEEAKQTNGDLKVDTGKWVTKLAETEHYEALKDDVRFNQDQPSKKELLEEEKQVKETVKELDKYVNEQLSKEREFDKETKEVLKSFETQIIDAGYSKEEARSLKYLYQFIPVMAKKIGVTPKQLADQIGIKIVKGIDLDTSEIFEQELGTHPMPELLLKDENGNYQYDKSTISWMAEGIRNGEAGKRIPKGDTFAGVGSTFPSWFKDKGYTKKQALTVLSKQMKGEVLTDGQKRLLEDMYLNAVDSLARGELYQKKIDQTQTAEFKAWFGDSKVVDANGKPLVVYHGTDKKFSKINMKKGSQGVFWVTSDKSAIERGEVGAQKSGVIMEMYLKMENPAGWDEYEKLSLGQIEDRGFDGVILKDKDGSFNAIVFKPNQIKSVKNKGSFNPEDPNILRQSNMGSFSKIGKDRIIKIFKNKDQSTLMHESAHAFLDVIQEYSKTNEKIKADLDGILKWFGVDSYDKVTVEHHERFARGFEAYLLEGKSPSDVLRKAFNTFKLWLIGLYKDIAGIQRSLNEQMGSEQPPIIDDNIRQIFDAMMATEEEINAGEIESGFVDIGIEDPEVRSAIENAKIESEAFLMKRKMQELELKKSKEYREKYDQLQDDFAAQLGQRPIYNAFSVLRTGRSIDGVVVGDIKINPDSIPAEDRKMIPRGTTSKETGIDYKAASDFLGYESSDQFLYDYLNTPELDEQARHLADEYIKLHFSELRNPINENDPALEAIHTDSRAHKLRLEYDYLFNKARPEFNKLARRVIAREPIDQTVRKQAQKFVAKLNVNELKPYSFLRAERKASRDAAKFFTRGDFEASLKAKKIELFNHEVVKFVNEANRDVEKSLRNFSKMFKKNDDLRKSRDLDYVNAARAVLEKYGISRKKLEPPLEYLAKVKQYAPDVYNSLGEMISSAIYNAADYKTVSYDKFSEMRDSVQTLWDMSKSQRESDIAGRKVSDEQILKELSEQIDKHDPVIKGPRVALTRGEKIAVKLLGTKAALTRVEHWSDYMDLGDFDGPYKKYVYQPVSDAVTQYILAKNQVVEKYKNILEKHKNIFISEPIYAENLGVTFDNHGQLLMLILHSGNLSNKSKLVRGYGWGSVNEDGSLNSTRLDAFIEKLEIDGVLTKQHYEAAQEIWDLFDSIKPLAQKAHKQMYGFYFSEITAEPLKTRFGEYKGGYIPAKVNPDLVKDAEDRKLAEELEGNNSFQFPTTGKGFTKSRVDSYAAPLDLDINMLGGHLDSVMRFSYIEPTIKNSARIIMNKGFSTKLAEVDSEAKSEMLVPWLQRSASQKTVEVSKDKMGQTIDMAAHYLRKTVAMQIMTLNVTNSLQQYTGLIVAATEVQPGALANATLQYSTQRQAVLENMLSKSDFMKSIMDTNLYEMNQAIEKIIVDPNVFQDAQTFADKHTYFLQTATQNMVNTIVWSGAYDQAVGQKMSEKDAIRFADSAVRKTQGTMRAEDISRFQVGSATKALFFQFAGYFNMLLNQQASKLAIIHKTTGFKKGFGKAAYMHIAGFAIPAVISGLLVELLAARAFSDDDEDSNVVELLKISGNSYIKSAFPMFPVAGQVASAYYGRKATDVIYDDRLNVSPVISFLESAVKGDEIIYKGMTDAEIKKNDVKDFLTLVGLVSGLPVGPIGKPIGYMMDVKSGKAQPSGPIDITRGLVTGQAGK